MAEFRTLYHPRRLMLFLKFALLVFFIYATILDFWERPAHWLETNEHGKLIGYFGIWIICVLAIFCLSNSPYHIWRIICAAVFSIAAGFSLAFYNISGSPPDLTDILILWSARHDTTNAMSFFLPKLQFPCIVALLGFLAMALPGIAIRGGKLFRLAVFGLFPIAPLALVSVVLMLNPFGVVAYLPQQYTPIVLWAAVIAVDQRSEWNHPHSSVSLPLEQGKQVKDIVLIVDESITAEAISLNASHNITPFIKKNAKSFINYGIATSGSNCSANSNFLLRVGASPQNFEESIRQWPYIWAYAHQAGYKTLYIDGQRSPKTLQNYMTPQESQTIDSIIQLGGLEPKAYDTDNTIADLIKTALEDDEKTFIYAVKAGAHFPYDDRYPKDQTIFSPTLSGGKKTLGEREAFLNSYKNAVIWSVDHFFEHLLSGLDLRDAAVIYTSDHGQALLENGRLQTHCSGKNPQLSEGLVPLMVLTKDAKWEDTFIRDAAEDYNRASHFNIFPTLLTLMGYQPEGVFKRYGASLVDRIDGVRAFAYDDIFGIFGQKVKWQEFPREVVGTNVFGPKNEISLDSQPK